MFAGFASGGVPPSGKGEMFFHYVMYEAEDVDPAVAPCLIWYNGGPGSPSAFGMFQELGPLYINADSEKTAEYNTSGIPTPLRNPYTWSKRVNLFAVDSPAPVGFSFCTEDGPSGDGDSCGAWNDTAVFAANRNVLVGLFTDIFPELKKNELFLVGESYAGVYVPGIVNEILSAPGGLNLKGYAVGDGCMASPPVNHEKLCKGPFYDIEFFGGHGQFSNELRDNIRRDCPRDMLCSGNLSAICTGYVTEMRKEIGAYDVYNLYDDCPTGDGGSRMRDFTHRMAAHGRTMVTGALNDYVCDGTTLPDFLTNNAVKAALGVPLDDYFFSNGQFNYSEITPDTAPFHIRAVKAGLRVLAYQGDTDTIHVNSEGYLQDAFVRLWPKAGLNRTETWRPWTVDGKRRMGGYAMEWNNGQAAWLSVRGSGHMVPLNKPAQALTMINAFVFNTGYPKLLH
jgi:carboxypeptidase C (cathepsin A)